MFPSPPLHDASRRAGRVVASGFAALTLGLLGSMFARAAAPVLFSRGAFQSPVAAAPDDLVLIPGSGFAIGDTVVYEAIAEGQSRGTRPSQRPRLDDQSRGNAQVVSYENTPNSLTVTMPASLLPNRTYELRVVSRSGEWSNPILINDARPLWLTPSQVSEQLEDQALPRYLKVIGRNLRKDRGVKSYVRLQGPETFVIASASDSQESSIYSESVIQIVLPAHMKPGIYKAQLSRDGTQWLEIPQRLDVAAARPSREFTITDKAFGACGPNEERDVTACLIAAIAAARAAGGGTVVFPPGIWEFSNAKAVGVAVGDGIIVPSGVGLRGAGRDKTTLLRAASWDCGSTNAILTLQGQNRVSGFRFKDARRYTVADAPSPFIQLGIVWYRAEHGGAASVDDVRIIGNVFDQPRIAIASGGLPIHRVTISDNEFGAFLTALTLGGDRSNVAMPFQVADSVITHNLFKPGSYLDLQQGQGAIAAVMGASLRVDFSNNTADGTAADYLYEPGDARGWRAGFFWHMNNSHEMLLIAKNVASCTGDKAGDGEAIALDNNANTFAFNRARDVIAADSGGVVAAGSLQMRQDNHAIDAAHFYEGHWIQIVDGPGVGQSRKIMSYTIDATRKTVAFRVFPEWDVAPVGGQSKVTVGRQFWQTYVLDNHVDQRQPLCLKSNRTRSAGGLITVWAQTSDSLVAGNKQYDSDGIAVQQTYVAAAANCPDCGGTTTLQSFLEISDNLIDGEYAWNSDCSRSGILISHSASPTADSPPPIASYGVSIAHNTIARADGYDGGAITVPATWFRGPPPNRWPLVNNLLIFHNSIADITGEAPQRRCEKERQQRSGIHLGASGLVWRSVLYANRCERVHDPLVDGGTKTVRVCAAADPNSCECAAQERQTH